MQTISIRGAVTAQNTKEDILSKTEQLLEEIIEKNKIDIRDIESILFTATKDLDQVYPAVAARNLGIVHASLMCVQELFVEGSLDHCIRLSLRVLSTRTQKDAVHVYLGEAKKLRPDLNQQ
ncbi:MAG: chorismate mutase [Clostridiales bacterium]|nr:chorismate mutase [Clostridiales bacterium]